MPAHQQRMSSDYQQVADAIRFLETYAEDQPSLAQTATAIGLSTHHFQRLFQRWAGVSPKRLLQSLTLERARTQLDAGQTTVRAALDSGLSGSGRLHGLFVTLQAVTQGEYQRQGNGLTIEYGYVESPFGTCLIGVTGRGVCWLSFADHRGPVPLEALRSDWPRANLGESDATAAGVSRKIFTTTDPTAVESLAVFVRGSNFQVRVWEALLNIPLGRTATYGDIATFIGQPKASRAVGSAVGANLVSFLIPCHRVIRGDGSIGGYRWGPERKKVMLAWERANAQPGSPSPT